MRKVKVFIVEDEIVIVRGLEESLRSLGYRACGFAFSGEQAIGLIEREKPDLVLVDINLRGDMDGIELAQRITSRQKVPVIYITAYSDREVLERAKLTDPCGYIVKPVRDNQLKVNIELALERCRRDREKNDTLERFRQTIEELQRELTGRMLQLENARKELGAAMDELDNLRLELNEVNNSLLALTARTARAREELRMEVAAVLRSKIMPILRKLRSNPAFSPYQIELDMLSMHIYQLAPNLPKHSDGTESLSITELRIAALIKNGLTSEQIAQQLYLSLDTVKTHRRSIRRKLGLLNQPTNLSTHLIRRWGNNESSVV